MVLTEISENNSNIFYINSEIGETFHKDFIVPFMQEMKVQKKLRDGSMHIYIYSPGGDLFGAIELISLIEKCKSDGIKVITYVNSFAASAASLIAITGSERYVGKNATHYIHSHSGVSITENNKQRENDAKFNKELNDILVGYYEKYTKIKKLKEKLEDTNYTITGGKELIKQGLADFITEITPI